MGKPSSKNQLKSKRIYLRCTPNEHAQIASKAKRLGIPISKYLIHLALNEKKLEQNSVHYTRLFTAVNKIGANINQSVKAINQAQGRFSREEIETHINDLKQQMQRIITTIYSK